MKVTNLGNGEIKIRYGALRGNPKVKIYVSEYEMLLEEKTILDGIREQLDSEKWAVSIIGIKDLESYIKELQKVNNEWNNKYMKLQLDNRIEINMLKSNITLNAKPFIPKETA